MCDKGQGPTEHRGKQVLGPRLPVPENSAPVSSHALCWTQPLCSVLRLLMSKLESFLPTPTVNSNRFDICVPTWSNLKQSRGRHSGESRSNPFILIKREYTFIKSTKTISKVSKEGEKGAGRMSSRKRRRTGREGASQTMSELSGNKIRMYSLYVDKHKVYMVFKNGKL